MLKKLGFLTILGFSMVSGNNTFAGWFSADESEPHLPPSYAGESVEQATYPAQMKMPTSIVVCRSKQCAPAKLSQSKEFIYNTLLHMFDSNAREKALVCEAHSTTHACTEEFVTVPITVGVTPANMFVDSVNITDVSISQSNTMAMELILNWSVSYNGQIPVCRPSKTLLYVKDVNNVIIEDNGYNCRMTTIGSSTIKTMFAIDYIDLDYGYIGGFYSIGLSGPAFGGGNGYMIIRLPNEIYSGTQDYTPTSSGNITPPSPMMQDLSATTQSRNTGQYLYDAATKKYHPLPAGYYMQEGSDEAIIDTRPSSGEADVKEPLAPNVDTIIHYNHPAQMYDELRAKEEAQANADRMEQARKQNLDEWRKKLESEAVDFGGAKVYPIPSTNNVDKTAVTPKLKNELNVYNNATAGRYVRPVSVQPAANNNVAPQNGAQPAVANPMAPVANQSAPAQNGAVDKNTLQTPANNAFQPAQTPVESRRFE